MYGFQTVSNLGAQWKHVVVGNSDDIQIDSNISSLCVCFLRQA